MAGRCTLVSRCWLGVEVIDTVSREAIILVLPPSMAISQHVMDLSSMAKEAGTGRESRTALALLFACICRDNSLHTQQQAPRLRTHLRSNTLVEHRGGTGSGFGACVRGRPWSGG